MRKIIRTLFPALLAMLFLSQPIRGEAVKAPKKECHAYVVMDAGSGQVLFGQDVDKQIYPASTTKLMTAIVCVENGDVNGKIKTKSEIVDNTTPGTYALGIPGGVTFTFKDLLNISLLSSAADATDSLAAGVFGSKEACVEAMNKKCRELGLTHTHFDNPVGSDIGAGYNEIYTTAREMSVITRYAMSVPLIRDVVRKASYSTESGMEMEINTTNWFVRGMISYDTDLYRVIGSKSGTTNAAGHVFIATAMDPEGHEVICAFFGNVSKESTFRSIRSLYNYTFKKIREGKLKVSKSNYDIRYSSGLGAIYRNYQTLDCLPTENDGRYYPGKSINRLQLALMLMGIDNLSESKALRSYAVGNLHSRVTSLSLAKLVQRIYPSRLSKKQIRSALKDVQGADRLNEEEQNAFASYLKAGLAPDGFCRNPGQIILRSQALIFADHLADYQVKYQKNYPMNYGTVKVKDGEASWYVTSLNLKYQNSLAGQKAAYEAEKARKEEERKAREEAERKAKEEAEKAKQEEERKAKEEAEKAKQEEERKAREEKERLEKEEARQAAATTAAPKSSGTTADQSSGTTAAQSSGTTTAPAPAQ